MLIYQCPGRLRNRKSRWQTFTEGLSSVRLLSSLILTRTMNSIIISALQMRKWGTEKRLAQDHRASKLAALGLELWDISGQSLLASHYTRCFSKKWNGLKKKKKERKRANKWGKKLRATIMPDTCWVFTICLGTLVHVNYPIKFSKPR